ncbi:cardiolipin synthase ClsB [Pantoea sp. 1.19]|uniref:cardiolipin synthase ClsB n=1 Tax=Pantoea sp. 1.19 TaxID=1925589 RepID=UPI000949044C|nr:cardiolipin synthase ClsB [Pantoea sp. 1.19]
MKPAWRSGNQIRLLINGDAFFPRVFDAIRQAKRSVVLETFILFYDNIGRELHAVLQATAARGVSVEVMVDAYGSPDLEGEFINTLTAAGVRFVLYDPGPRLLGVRTNVFRRLHRKIVTVDDEVAFVGGINYSAEHMIDYGPEAKQDYSVEVRGPVVDDIVAYTREAIGSQQKVSHWWSRHGRIRPDRPLPGEAQALFVWRDNDQHRDDIERHYLQMLREAKRQVIIANAYFFPGYRLLKEMRNAARRGVRVKLIVQGEPDMPIVKVGAELLYTWLVNAGVEIYEYIRRPLHAKIALQDSHWVTVGSSNLDPLSLSLNLEANLIFHDRAFNQQLTDHLTTLLKADCRRVDASDLPRRNLWQLSKNVVVFHFLRHFPAIAGWLPAHTPRLAEVDPPVQPELETQDRIDVDNGGVKP